MPIILVIAVLTFAGWLIAGSFEQAFLAAVLVIACPVRWPATPTAIMVGVGRGAERHVLIRSGAALEASLAGVDTIVFDKTGTLTEGRMVVALPQTEAGVSEHELLTVAAAVEQRSEHPLAVAIRQAAADRGFSLPSVDNFATEPGSGASAVC